MDQLDGYASYLGHHDGRDSRRQRPTRSSRGLRGAGHGLGDAGGSGAKQRRDPRRCRGRVEVPCDSDSRRHHPSQGQVDEADPQGSESPVASSLGAGILQPCFVRRGSIWPWGSCASAPARSHGMTWTRARRWLRPLRAVRRGAHRRRVRPARPQRAPWAAVARAGPEAALLPAAPLRRRSPRVLPRRAAAGAASTVLSRGGNHRPRTTWGAPATCSLRGP